MMRATIIFLFRIRLSVFINLLRIQFCPFATNSEGYIHDTYSTSHTYCGAGEVRLWQKQKGTKVVPDFSASPCQGLFVHLICITPGAVASRYYTQHPDYDHHTLGRATQQRTNLSDLRLYCILCSFAIGIPIQLSCENTNKDGGQNVTTF